MSSAKRNSELEKKSSIANEFVVLYSEIPPVYDPVGDFNGWTASIGPASRVNISQRDSLKEAGYLPEPRI